MTTPATRGTAARIWPWLRLAAAAGILTALVWKVGTGAFLTGLRLIDTRSVVLALAIGLLTTVTAAGRWVLVTRGLGLPLRLPAAVAAYYRSTLLNSVLPAGVLGDVDRAVSHGRDSGDVGRGVRAVVLERFAGQAVLLVAGVTALALHPDLLPGLSTGPGLLVLLGAALVVAGLLAAKPAWRGAATRTLTDARALLGGRTAAGIVALSALTIAGHVALFLLAARLAGVAAPVTTLVPLIVLALVVMALPLNVGGWGPREGFTAVAFSATGLGAAAGITTAVVYGVLSLVAALPGVLALRTREGAGAPGTRGPARPAPPGLSPAKPVTDDRPRPIPCTGPVRARGGGADRRVASPPSRSPV